MRTNDNHDVDHDDTVSYEPSAGPGTGAADSVAGAFRFALVVERGPRAGLTYVLGSGETTAGRGDDNDIFLGDVTVSRHHVMFTVSEDGLYMVDRGSTNGTYVNHERADEAQLRPGDEVIIGKYHLIVVEGDV